MTGNMYPLTAERAAELEKRFTYHPVQAGQPERYVMIRDEAHELARILCQMCPDGRELALALTSLDQVVMWANAAIARGEA